VKFTLYSLPVCLSITSVKVMCTCCGRVSKFCLNSPFWFLKLHNKFYLPNLNVIPFVKFWFLCTVILMRKAFQMLDEGLALLLVLYLYWICYLSVKKIEELCENKAFLFLIWSSNYSVVLGTVWKIFDPVFIVVMTLFFVPGWEELW
jgi:hypothetical protein